MPAFRFPDPCAAGRGQRVAAAAVLAASLAACSSLPPPASRAPSDPPATASRLPAGQVPPAGRCAIWYRGVRADRQPLPMSCNKAHADAESWGGVVVWREPARGGGRAQVAEFDYGPHALRGIPPDRLPPPGRCRLWIDGIPAHLQPAPDACAQVEARQRVSGGRVLYMPATDLR